MAESLDELINKWEKDTCFLSWHETKHPAFRAVVAMGQPIIPELLKRVGNGWLPTLALFEIVGRENSPKIKKEDYGKLDALNEAWRLWGKAKGYL